MRQGDISAPEDVTEDFKEDHEISDSWRRAKDTFSRQLGVVRTTLVWIQRGGLWISALLLTSSPCTWEALLYNLLKSCFFFFFFYHPGLCLDVISWVLYWTPSVKESLTLLPTAIALHVRCCWCLVLSSVAPSSSCVYLSEMWFRGEESSCSSQGFSWWVSVHLASFPSSGWFREGHVTQSWTVRPGDHGDLWEGLFFLSPKRQF